MEWYGDEYLADVEAGLFVRVGQAAEALADVVRFNIGEPGTPDDPSEEGEYPHRVTGELQRSIVVRPYDKLTYIVGSDSSIADYGAYVEESRPFLMRTLHEESQNIRRTVVGR